MDHLFSHVSIILMVESFHLVEFDGVIPPCYGACCAWILEDLSQMTECILSRNVQSVRFCRNFALKKARILYVRSESREHLR